MATPILKFRCYQCSKLLGVSPSKAGRTTSCPNCKAELIVPEPDQPDDDIPEIAIEQKPEAIAPPTPPPKKQAATDPGFSWEELDQSVFQTVAQEVEARASEEKVPSPPEPEMGEGPPADDGQSILDVRVEPPEIKAPRQSKRAATTSASEVVLSQAVLASWSLFALLAIGIAFVAGVFVGHYVWK